MQNSSTYLIQGHGSRDLLAVGLGAPLPVVYDQVDGHLSLQAAYVPVTEVITQLVHLRWREWEASGACTQTNTKPTNKTKKKSFWKRFELCLLRFPVHLFSY